MSNTKQKLMTRSEKLEAVLQSPNEILRIFPGGTAELGEALWEEVLKLWDVLEAARNMPPYPEVCQEEMDLIAAIVSYEG